MWCWTKGGFVAQSMQLGRRPERITVKMKDITLLLRRCFHPNECCKIVGNRSFSLTQGGSDRILAFGVMRHVKLMERSDVVLGDGTFQVAPHNCGSSSTPSMSMFRDSVFPWCTSCCQGSQSHSTKSCCVSYMVPSVAHKTWLFDFEASMLSAHKESMEHASLGGCLFHFTKAIQRKVDGMGFRQKYSDDTAFRRRVMALSTLAYLPLPYVECALDELPIVEYFEHTYFGTDRVNSRHPNAFRSRPMFAPAFWNVHGRYLFGFPTTTNAMERFHLAHNSCCQHFSSFHPSLYGGVAPPIGLGGHACGGHRSRGTTGTWRCIHEESEKIHVHCQGPDSPQCDANFVTIDRCQVAPRRHSGWTFPNFIPRICGSRVRHRNGSE